MPSYASDYPTVYNSLLKDLPSNELAVDIATGTGQAVGPLARYFKHVSDTDTSKSQIEKSRAPGGTSVEFRVGDAHDTGLEGGQADLVTIAQALHWLDIPRFYTEAARILKPGGVLGIITYDFGHLRLIPSDDGEEASKAFARIWDFGSTSKTFGPYWAAPRKLVQGDRAA